MANSIDFVCSRHDGLIVYIILIGQITDIISKLDRRVSILTYLAASGQNGGDLSFAVPCTGVHGAALF